MPQVSGHRLPGTPRRAVSVPSKARSLPCTPRISITAAPAAACDGLPGTTANLPKEINYVKIYDAASSTRPSTTFSRPGMPLSPLNESAPQNDSAPQNESASTPPLPKGLIKTKSISTLELENVQAREIFGNRLGSFSKSIRFLQEEHTEARQNLELALQARKVSVLDEEEAQRTLQTPRLRKSISALEYEVTRTEAALKREEEQQMRIAVTSSAETLRALMREKERQSQRISRKDGSQMHRERTSLYDQGAGSNVFGTEHRTLVLNSTPSIMLEKKGFPKLGRTKKLSLQNIRMAESKAAAEGIMAALGPATGPDITKPRYKRAEMVKRHTQQLHIEVLEVDGNQVLGIPSTTTLQHYSERKRKTGDPRQILIAMHVDKPKTIKYVDTAADTRKQQAHKQDSDEVSAASIRSGAAVLNKSLALLRVSLAESRAMHNAFNEIPKYHTFV